MRRRRLETEEVSSGEMLPEEHQDRLKPLVEEGLILHQALGLPGWDGKLEEVFLALDAALTRLVRDEFTRTLRFPPVMSRAAFEKSAFSDSFPHLFGSIHAFQGTPADHELLKTSISRSDDWSAAVRLTDYVLVPAACYPVYQLHSGILPERGVSLDVSGYCFRHEPSTEPGRFVSFRQREFVRIGSPEIVSEWFDRWQQRLPHLIARLGLDGHLIEANDPFFGVGAKLLASAQREQKLKLETVAPIGGTYVAVASCNYHRDHFARAFDIRMNDGFAHSACVGFGLERLGLSLLDTHDAKVDDLLKSLRDISWT